MESGEEINMTTFPESTSTPVQQQPLPDREEEHRFRRLIPISTIDWTSSPTSHFVPLSGLDFLTDVENLLIQQSVELSDGAVLLFLHGTRINCILLLVSLHCYSILIKYWYENSLRL